MSALCEFYPCHEDLPNDFSCEFCYCPEYNNKDKCSGQPEYIKGPGHSLIKDCSNCTVNHTSLYINTYYKKLRKAPIL